MAEHAVRTGTADGGYTYRLYTSIHDVNADEWNGVCQHPEESLFMDTRFIAAVESSMHEACKLWYVVFYDANDSPAACAVLCNLRVDLLIFAGKQAKKIGTMLRTLASSFMYVNVFFCGLPVSVGQSALRFVRGADHRMILRALDGLTNELAIQQKAPFIVYKEFDADELGCTEYLAEFGFRRADSLPMHYFRTDFDDFADYCGSLKKPYRKSINRSARKFEAAGMRVVVHEDGKIMRELHTPEVHRLYEAVVMNSDYKLEVLPVEFFHELAERFSDHVCYILIYQGDRIVAFSCALFSERSYYGLFCGLDYSLNHEVDLYFNLIYSDLNNALTHHVSKIQVGQTANTFKSRLGCYHKPLYLYAKGAGPVSRWLLGTFFNMIFPPQHITASNDIFKAVGESADA